MRRGVLVGGGGSNPCPQEAVGVECEEKPRGQGGFFSLITGDRAQETMAKPLTSVPYWPFVSLFHYALAELWLQ